MCNTWVVCNDNNWCCAVLGNAVTPLLLNWLAVNLHVLSLAGAKRA